MELYRIHIITIRMKIKQYLPIVDTLTWKSIVDNNGGHNNVDNSGPPLPTVIFLDLPMSASSPSGRLNNNDVFVRIIR